MNQGEATRHFLIDCLCSGCSGSEACAVSVYGFWSESRGGGSAARREVHLTGGSEPRTPASSSDASTLRFNRDDPLGDLHQLRAEQAREVDPVFAWFVMKNRVFAFFVKTRGDGGELEAAVAIR